MTDSEHIVVFRIDRQRYALPISELRNIVRAVAITPLPGAPGIVRGVIDIAGTILPVINIRSRFHLPERSITPADQFLIAWTGRRSVALAIDEAVEVVELPRSEITPSSAIAGGSDSVRGVITLADGLVLICNLEECLSLEEETALDHALHQEAHHVA